MLQQLFNRLWLALFLILGASSLLLITDGSRLRNKGQGADLEEKIPSLAFFQYFSQGMLDTTRKGLFEKLKVEGFEDGKTCKIKEFNAAGDLANANLIAKTIVNDPYDLALTITTPSLQTFAKANGGRKMHHVFGMVSDPPACGVNISRDDPKDHPPYMTGIGTMQPVADTFRMAKRLNPKLKKVGVAWNPSEANSEACTLLARKVCAELKIELIESNIDGSSAIREAVSSLLARGVEAIWVGGDITVMTSIEAVLGPARASNIPVFTNLVGACERGSIFDLGNDYYQVGVIMGEMASRVLRGESPASIPIKYNTPQEFWINKGAFSKGIPGWSIPADVEREANVVVDDKGTHWKTERSPLKSGNNNLRKDWKIGVVAFVDTVITEEVRAAFDKVVPPNGEIGGVRFATTYRNAQGDVATLNAIIDEYISNNCDMIVVMSTPSLQAAMRKIEDKPIVFCVVFDPIAAGGGKSFTDHKPNVTGTVIPMPSKEMVEGIRRILPGARSFGTLFCPGEINSVMAKDRFQEYCKANNYKLVSLPINNATEAAEAASSLCQSNLDAIVQVSDNLSNSSFPAISRACENARIPLFAFSPGLVRRGALMGIGVDFAANGAEGGEIVLEILKGKSIADMPFRTTSKLSQMVNLDVARKLKLTIPKEMLESATDIVDSSTGKK